MSSFSPGMGIWQASVGTISFIPPGEILTSRSSATTMRSMDSPVARPDRPHPKEPRRSLLPEENPICPFIWADSSPGRRPYFYARTSVYHLNHFKDCIREALHWKGFSFVDIISDCIELNGRRLGFKTAHQMFKWFNERFHVVEGVREYLKEDELGIARMGNEESPKPEEKPAAKPDVFRR